MNILSDGFAFIFQAGNWPGPNGIGIRLAQHVLYSVIAVAIAALIALPLGIITGHTGRHRNLILTVTGGARALPTFGLLLLAILFVGIDLWPVIAVLVILAVPPILAATYAGIEGSDRAAVDGARSSGMTELQIITRVELPLALPLIVGGVRSAILQVIATAAIAGYVAQGTLGRFLLEGITRHDYALAVVGAILIAALALIADALLALTQKFSSPTLAAPRTPTTRSLLTHSH
ncbi:MAG: ABC transporter permease subunit [Beijerinckiaceae bacterium]|nr:ABC transporter permease subunit [Beijerinckiaceae bacterium]